MRKIDYEDNEDEGFFPRMGPDYDTRHLEGKTSVMEDKPIYQLQNGVYTIQSPKEGAVHRTFRIRTQPEDSTFAPGERVLSLLIGQDNTNDYKGFAFVFESPQGQVLPKVVLWKKYRQSPWTEYSKMLLQLIVEGEPSQLYKAGYCVLRSSTCLRCNRPLTTPESIRCGYGPECAEKLGIAW